MQEFWYFTNLFLLHYISFKSLWLHANDIPLKYFTVFKKPFTPFQFYDNSWQLFWLKTQYSTFHLFILPLDILKTIWNIPPWNQTLHKSAQVAYIIHIFPLSCCIFLPNCRQSLCRLVCLLPGRFKLIEFIKYLCVIFSNTCTYTVSSSIGWVHWETSWFIGWVRTAVQSNL